MRHRKGHGVHSPYIYNIVREVFMSRGSDGSSGELFERLTALGSNRKCALELQNLFTHCGYKSFSIDSFDPKSMADIIVCSKDFSQGDTLNAIDQAASSGSTIVLLRGASDSFREHLNHDIIAKHSSTSVDKRGYLLIFNNHLPKQHFIL